MHGRWSNAGRGQAQVRRTGDEPELGKSVAKQLCRPSGSCCTMCRVRRVAGQGAAADWREAAAAGAGACPPSPLAGVTASAGMTSAPAFSSCLMTEAISSSQLLANGATPYASNVAATSAMSTPIRARSGPDPGKVVQDDLCRVVAAPDRVAPHLCRGRRRPAASLPAWC